MNCPECDEQIPDGSEFCNYCGAEISSGNTDKTESGGLSDSRENEGNNAGESSGTNVNSGAEAISDIVSEAPDIVKREQSKYYIKLIIGVFFVAGLGVGIFQAILNVSVAKSFLGSGFANVIPLFTVPLAVYSSILLAVFTSLSFGYRMSDMNESVVTTAVGSGSGFVALAIVPVVLTSATSSPGIMANVGIDVTLFLKSFLFSALVIGGVGGGTGYISFKLRDDLSGEIEQTDFNLGHSSLVKKCKEAKNALGNETSKRYAKWIIALYVLMTIGYLATRVVLDTISGQVMASFLSSLASFGFFYGGVLVAAMLGIVLAQILELDQAMAATALGSGAGIVVMGYGISIFGSFGAGGSLSMEGLGEGMTGNVAGIISTLIANIMPGVTDVSLISFIGAGGAVLASILVSYMYTYIKTSQWGEEI